MPPETSWEQLAGMYDGFIFDQFGVMHNGAVALEGAPALVDRLAAAGKKLGKDEDHSKAFSRLQFKAVKEIEEKRKIEDL